MESTLALEENVYVILPRPISFYYLLEPGPIQEILTEVEGSVQLSSSLWYLVLKKVNHIFNTKRRGTFSTRGLLSFTLQ
jgi:hypothetical protein